MRSFHALILCLVFLHSYTAQAQSPFKKICLGQLEISFFNLKKNYAKAAQFCVEYGGNLVKVDSATVQHAIENALGPPDGSRFYIGAKDTGNDIFKWISDGTKVGANGYTNWRRGQPNNPEEKCIGIGDHYQYQWTDVQCSYQGSESRYICQREESSSTLVTRPQGNNSFVCHTNVLDASVKWVRNSVETTATDKTGVYQSISTRKSILMFENANISEAGTYTCVGEIICTPKQISAQVNVDGTPSLQKIENNKCNSSLRVTWKPNRAAVGFPHRIAATGDKNVTLFEIPTNEDMHQTEIAGLAPLADYTVEISACLTTEICVDNSSAATSNKTMIISNPATSVFLVNKDDGECKASWWPPGQEKTFTLTINCSIDSTRRIEEREFTSTTVKRLKSINHLFQPPPNRKCEVSVQVQGCGEISKSLAASDFCVTAAKEPGHVEAPIIFGTLLGTSKLLMKLPKPNEENGLISCIFVIVCYGNCGHKNLTIKDLELANKTDIENLREGVNAIAMAIPMSRLLLPIGPTIPPAHYFELSNGNITQCNVYNTTTSDATSTNSENGSFYGRNIISNDSFNIGTFLVTVTPSKHKVFLKSSSVVIIRRISASTAVVTQNTTATTVTITTATKGSENETSDKQSSSNSWFTGLAVGIGLTCLVIGAVSTYAFMRKRLRPAQPKEVNDHATNEIVDLTQERPSVMQREEPIIHNYESNPETCAYEEIGPRNNESSAYESYNA